MGLFEQIEWKQLDQGIKQLIIQNNKVKYKKLVQGFEAETVKIIINTDEFVLKLWNKSSKPNIQLQYDILKSLNEKGVAVSKPLGWGNNKEGHQALLTTYDGEAIKRLDDTKIEEIATVLYNIHIIPTNDFSHIKVPHYHFKSYFFPNIEHHEDLSLALETILSQIEINQHHIIHGDYHYRNIVENQNKLTIIDWTNAQLGDPRYDFAWSYLLKRLYIAKRYADVFHTTYLTLNPIHRVELEKFEALACLRWLLLSRYEGVPIFSPTLKRLTEYMSEISILKQLSIPVQHE